MRFKQKTSLVHQRGLSLVELLVYLGILGMLSVGVGFSIRYFLNHSIEATSNAQYGLEAEYINAALKRQMTGGSRVQAVSGYSTTNGNYCYEISENKPVSFSSVDVTNGALFQYRVTGSTTPTLQTAEPKLASTASLGLPSGATAASTSRSLSMWVKLSNVDGNNRVLFDYSPNPASSSYKMVVSITGGNTVAIDMGMGLSAFNYSVSNIRNGDWHHLVVTAGNLSMAGSSPSLYVDGAKVSATANSTSAPSSFAANLSYQLNIGSSGIAPWSLGPVGLWSRVLTTQEIAKLGRMESVNVDNAFWLNEPRAVLSTSSTNVTNGSTINARAQKGFLLFKKDREVSNQTYFKIYTVENAASCPNPTANENPASEGFKLLTDSTCVSPTGTQPILAGANAAGQDLGFQWRCNLSNGKQQAAATVVAGNTTSTVIKSDEACGLPIKAEDFATTDSADTAFVIIDNFDANLDLMAFKPSSGANMWPSGMPADTATGLNITSINTLPSGNLSPPAVEGGGSVSVTWFADSANNVGMMKVVHSHSISMQRNRSKSWWVDNVFKKIIYKNKIDVYAAERKIVFALGDLWPIKVCGNLGYKSSYHFYKMESVPTGTTPTMLRAYRHAYSQRYHGMTGYLGNLRCQNEKDQVSKRVFDIVGTNINAVISIWATRQDDMEGNSRPNFAESNGNNSREYLANGTRQNDSFPDSFFSGNASGLRDSFDRGNTQWRLFGGPHVDHNVIVLTDVTNCRRYTQSDQIKQGCQGMNTITLDSNIPTNSPLRLRLRDQPGGSQQFGWWHPSEPNESGSFIYMGWEGNLPPGQVGENFWDDGEPSNATGLGLYLLEYGDHPWDASTAADSAYKRAHAAANDTSSDLDPPNVATKRVKSVTAQYCK